MSKQNSWFKLSQICPGARYDVVFGPAEFDREPDSAKPGRYIRKGSTVVWNPEMKFSTSVATIAEANWNSDEEILAKLESAGIPRGCSFGYRKGEDLSMMYTETPKKPRAKKRDSVKVMRAEYSAMYEDGEKFEKGTIVKILFRKKFVRNDDGTKKFQNEYVRPSAEEITDFIKAEKKGLSFPA